MPSPSKFTATRRSRILEILSAGGSRAQAARAAGVHPAQLTRWLQRGKTAHPEGRWAEFYRAVRVAEAEDPVLVALKDEFDRMLGDPVAALRFLELSGEPGFTRRPDPEPIKVEVVHGPTISKGDPA